MVANNSPRGLPSPAMPTKAWSCSSGRFVHELPRLTPAGLRPAAASTMPTLASFARTADSSCPSAVIVAPSIANFLRFLPNSSMLSMIRWRIQSIVSDGSSPPSSRSWIRPSNASSSSMLALVAALYARCIRLMATPSRSKSSLRNFWLAAYIRAPSLFTLLRCFPSRIRKKGETCTLPPECSNQCSCHQVA